MRGYRSLCNDVIPQHRAKGGVAIFIKENCQHTFIPLQSQLQAVAIQIDYPFKLTICNLYLLDFTWNIQDLRNLMKQLPKPYMVTGDFNAHNPIWGSNYASPQGRIIQKLIEELNLILLNTGESTYINSRSNTFSAIDLTLCSPQTGHMFSWQTLSDHLFTDHYPIRIDFVGSYQQSVNLKH